MDGRSTVAALTALTAGSCMLKCTVANPSLGPALRGASVRGGPTSSNTEAACFATLATNDEYMVGVVALYRSLLAAGAVRAARPLVVMVTSEVSAGALDELRLNVPDSLCESLRVEVVQAMGNPAVRQGHRSKRRFNSVYTKLRVWGLTQYDRVVFLDADMVVLRDIPELFAAHMFHLAATVYEPYSTTHGRRFFDSAVMVLRPCSATLAAMSLAAEQLPSFDGGDAGFLNAFVLGRAGCEPAFGELAAEHEATGAAAKVNLEWAEELCAALFRLPSRTRLWLR